MSLEFLLFQSTQEPELMIVTNVGLGNTMSPSEEAFTCHREAQPELTATNAVTRTDLFISCCLAHRRHLINTC